MFKVEKQMQNKNLFEKIVEYMFLALLILVIGGVAYFNLSDIRCSLDPDFACTVSYYIEAIKSGTLNLANWNHTTSLEMDGSIFLAVPLSLVTGDIFKAIGIANILLVLLYVAVIVRLLHWYKVDKIFIYLTLLLVLTPYEYGMLDYFNMMFYGAAYYSIRTIVPILLLLILKLLKEEVYKNKNGKIEVAVFSVLYIGLLFLTAFSMGIFVVLCGLLPIFVWMILEMFIHGSPEFVLKKRVLGVWIGTFLSFAAGYLLHNKIYTIPSRTNMNLTNMGEFADNFKACLRGIYELLGAITLKDVPVLSVDGIIFCVKMVIVAAFLVSLFFNYIKFSNTDKEQKTAGMCLKNYLAFIFVWNFAVMLLADMRYPGNPHTEYRYFIIGVVPLIILFGMQLNELKKTFNDFQKGLAYIVLFAACVILTYGNHKNVVEKWDRSTYLVEFAEYADTLDVESVIFVGDLDSTVMIRPIDVTHKYGCFMPDTQTLNVSICSYFDSGHGYYYGNRHALALIEGTDIYQCMPAEIADHYVKVDKFKWFDIYISDVMLFP